MLFNSLIPLSHLCSIQAVSQLSFIFLLKYNLQSKEEQKIYCEIMTIFHTFYRKGEVGSDFVFM